MRFFAVASVLFATTLGVFASPVTERQTPQSIAAVLVDLSNIIESSTGQLLYATPANATQAILTPIINGITTAVSNAVTSLNSLVGQPMNVILASADGTTVLTAIELAAMFANVVSFIFQAIQAVLLLVNPIIYTVIFNMCVALGQEVCDMIKISVSLVGGLAAALLPLLVPIAPILSTLGLLSFLQGILGGLL